MTDLISRQAAIEVIDAVFPVNPTKSEYAQGLACGVALAKTYVEQLPSAQPERMKGKWIRKSPTAWSWTCSCCKRDNAYAYSAGKYYEPDILQDLFCPNCGADMR